MLKKCTFIFHEEIFKNKTSFKVLFGGKYISNKEYGNSSFKTYLTVSTVLI